MRLLIDDLESLPVLIIQEMTHGRLRLETPWWIVIVTDDHVYQGYLTGSTDHFLVLNASEDGSGGYETIPYDVIRSIAIP